LEIVEKLSKKNYYYFREDFEIENKYPKTRLKLKKFLILIIKNKLVELY